MKYIKTYEKISDEEFVSRNRYWKVRTDSPYYEISLKKIGMTDDELKDFLIIRNVNLVDKYFVYIELCWENIGSNYYWSDDPEIFKDDSPIYMGEIENEITPEELEDGYLKYNINKYNI